MSDAEYDELSKQINPEQKTGNEKLDKFFREEFTPDTGMWIRKHPELDKLHAMYQVYSHPDRKLIRFGSRVYERIENGT